LDAPAYEDLIFLGLVGLIDPPRADVPAAMAACARAGIRVVMATGDQAPTARTIAEAVGWGGDASALEGHELKPPPGLTPTERERLLRTDIFARVNPEQKLDLISLYQQDGAVVAMTGDGVNDAPALKKADIGIAMGLRGSQVAREAADMVLRDDAFSSIVAAVEQGRIIFSNIRKMVLYLLSCNLSEILVVSLAAAGGLPLPLLPLQILYLNLVTDVFPAFALGAGEGEAGVMRRPPRDPGESILARRHWMAIAGYGAVVAAATLASFGLALGWLGLGEAEAVTMSFLTLALAQLWHVFNMRDPGTALLANEITRNRYVWAALALCIVLIGIAYAAAPVAEVLRLVPLDGTAWTVVITMSLVPWLLGQGLKLRPQSAS
jgi:Ca2+-transporting ATPase